MADVQINQQKGKRTKSNPTLDLTPMVDLGFILITFFIYTTTLAESKMMDINMPYKPVTEGTSYIDTATLTIIPTKAHLYAVYAGAFKPSNSFKMYKQTDLRNIIMAKQSALKRLPATFSAQAHQLHVILKPNDDCEYIDVVSLLDEMTINNVPYFAIADITPEEKQILTKQLQ